MSEIVSLASSEPGTSRLPEEDSSDMDSDSDNEGSQIDIDGQVSTSSGLLSDCVSIVDSMQRLSHGPQLRERDLLLPSV